MEEILTYLEKNKQNKLANQLRVILVDQKKLDLEKENLLGFTNLVIEKVKLKVSRDNIITDIVMDAKKRNLM